MKKAKLPASLLSPPRRTGFTSMTAAAAAARGAGRTNGEEHAEMLLAD
jgi:hypothetical protein